MPGNKINAFATRKREEHRWLDHYMDGWPMDFNPSSTVTRLHVPAPASSFVESNKRSIISYGSLYSWPSHSLQLGSKVNSPISSSVTFNNSQCLYWAMEQNDLYCARQSLDCVACTYAFNFSSCVWGTDFHSHCSDKDIEALRGEAICQRTCSWFKWLSQD